MRTDLFTILHKILFFGSLFKCHNLVSPCNALLPHSLSFFMGSLGILDLFLSLHLLESHDEVFFSCFSILVNEPGSHQLADLTLKIHGFVHM